MSDTTTPTAMPTTFLSGGVRAINIGLAGFAGPIPTHGGSVVQVDWRPPAEGDRELGLVIARLEDDPQDPIGAAVARANADVLARILAARPTLVDVRAARDAIAFLATGRRLLHSGPPIEWGRMCGPMRGAVIGAALFEGWAATPEDVERLATGGGIDFAACHDQAAVGPMAGVVSPSMPVVVVENGPGRTTAHATLNEGLGKVLRFGAYDETVMDRLRWMAETLGPALSAAIAAQGPIDLKSLTAQALQMGDEAHNRNVAATSLFTRAVAPWVARTATAETAAAVLDFLRANDHFFLNLSMASAKATLDAARDVPGSSVVTAMSRNGVDFGIRLAGTGDRWYRAPVGVPDGLYFPGYGPDDANPDLGDSAITETVGLGGFAMAAAPAIVRFVGGTSADALDHTRRMYRITLGRNPDYGLPPLGFAGSPTGIDARRVVETGVAPVINTGIAHREPGVGQIGAGIAYAPLGCFADAVRGLMAGLVEEAAA